MVLHSLPSGFGEMLYYRRKSYMYERKGKLNVVIFMDNHTFNTQFMVSSTHTCNYWFYTHFLVVSERCYIIEENHTCMKEKES